jgi:hypothetical protein
MRAGRHPDAPTHGDNMNAGGASRKRALHYNGVIWLK